MLLYDVQRECDAYVRSPEMRPLIRQYIQKAIENICNANTPGKDWSFLLKKIDLTRDNASTDTLLIFNSPANLRALVEVLDLGGVDFNTLIGEDYAYTIEWSSRTLTISRPSDSPAFPSGTLAVKAYIAHPTVLVADTQHANPTWDTPWTPTWPAADAVWLPDEFFPLLVDTTLLELKRHEIEVAFTVQELEQAISQKLEEVRINYALQVYPLNVPATPDVKWLLAVGKYELGTERYKDRIVAFINEIADELSDVVKVPINGRPAPITEASSALPMISGFSVPAEFWLAGMRFKAKSVAGNIDQLTVDRWLNAKTEWQSNYAEANFAVSPPTTPTVDWLVAIGEKIMGGERFETQALAFVNEVASDLADMIKLDLASRPTAILTVSNAALPTFNSIACPAEFWAAGMVYKASFLIGKGTQDIYARWEKAKGDWSTSFYALNVQQQGFNLSTFGGLVDYIRRVWKTCRNEMQAWDIANEVVADIMERVNSESLMKTQTVIIINETQVQTLPDDFKCAVKVTINDVEIPGRGFTERGPAVPNITEYTGLKPTQQAFRIAGGKVLFDYPVKVGRTVKVYYYPYHTWTTTPSTAVPVKTSTVMKGVRAQVALVEKDTATASYWTQKYEQAIQQYDANQINNYPADNRMINATPSVNRRILRAFK